MNSRGALLDTHTFLWWVSDDERLSETASETIAQGQARILVSAATAWEISTKVRLGKLDPVAEVVERFEELLEQHRFDALAISVEHALLSGSFKTDHRDPFDRMLAAQSHIEGLALITKDPVFAEFGTEVIW